MAGRTVLVVDPANGADFADRTEAGGAAGVRLQPCSGGEAAARCLQELLAAGDEPVAVVLGPHLPDPLAAARQVHRVDPLVQMVFLADPDRGAQLRREMGLAPRIGTYWSIVGPDPAGLHRALQEAVRSTRQRRHMRTTLDRIKVRVATRPAADSPDYRKLILSDRYLASVLTHAQDAILSTDPGGAILTWNGAAARLFGRPDGDAVGKPIGLASEGDAAVVEGLVWAVREGKPEVRRELRLRRADGSAFDADATLAPVRDETGRLLAVSAIVRDVTEWRRMENELRERTERLVESDRRKDEFLALLGHELRNPLAPLRNGLQILALKGGPTRSSGRRRR